MLGPHLTKAESPPCRHPPGDTRLHAETLTALVQNLTLGALNFSLWNFSQKCSI